MPRVLVLLSTYNGERYLAEQLESLAQQVGVEVHGLVRDDGSTDGTRTILEAFARTHPRFEVHCEANIGWGASFHRLTQWAAERRNGFDYFAYCDQDDVWHSDKLQRAVQALSTIAGPALYVANVEFADERLRPQGLCEAFPKPDVTIAQMFVDVFILGCTFCFNPAMLRFWQQATSEPPPSHDRWLFLLARTVGQVVTDARPALLYRQHGANACGGHAAAELPLGRRLMKMFRDRKMISSHLVLLSRALAGRDFEGKAALDLLCRSRTSLKCRLEVLTTWRFLRLKKRIKILLGFL